MLFVIVLRDKRLMKSGTCVGTFCQVHLFHSVILFLRLCFALCTCEHLVSLTHLVKHGVLTVVSEILCYINHRYYYHYFDFYFCCGFSLA